jgi:thiamine biosynthesis protein ThiS
MTVASLLRSLRFTFPRIIVSIDGEVVPREDYATRRVPDEADVRVIHLMAGG